MGARSEPMRLSRCFRVGHAFPVQFGDMQVLRGSPLTFHPVHHLAGAPLAHGLHD